MLFVKVLPVMAIVPPLSFVSQPPMAMAPPLPALLLVKLLGVIVAVLLRSTEMAPPPS